MMGWFLGHFQKISHRKNEKKMRKKEKKWVENEWKMRKKEKKMRGKGEKMREKSVFVKKKHSGWLWGFIVVHQTLANLLNYVV